MVDQAEKAIVSLSPQIKGRSENYQ
jgi:hypothetical protein